MTTKSSRDRGQTNIDFIIAIAIFLIAFTFILGFMPRLFAPYADEEKPLVADRVASTLVDSLLAQGNDPGIIDTECTAGFFNGTDCPGFDASDPLIDRVGIDSTYRLNITVQRNVTGDSTLETLCYENGEVGECGSGERLAGGPDAPQSQRSVGASSRAVLLDGKSAIVNVKVW